MFYAPPSAALITPPRHRLSSLTADASSPEMRRPIIEEMMGDITKVVVSIAQTYTDVSCPALHFDELVAEGHYKLSQLIDKGWLERVPNRKEFFAVFKTTVNNHVRGLVHKHRFTIKRTGIKPPPREERNAFNATSTKPIEISLDDPESHLQIGSQEFYGTGLESELREAIERVLTPVEQIVLGQLVMPNSAALIFAELDAHRGRQPGSVKVRVKYAHMAEGAGLSEDLFMQAVSRIREKVKTVMDERDNTSWNLAVARLAVVFGLQIPGSIDKVVIKRLLTVAARDQVDKLTPELILVLGEAGAKPPVPIHGSDCRNSTLQCFGVLWKKNDRICLSCGLYKSCEVEAKNFGLDTVTLSPKLLGAKATRTAQIIPYDQEPEADPVAVSLTDDQQAGRASPPAPAARSTKSAAVVLPLAMNQKDDEILHYLIENFKAVLYEGGTYFKHREASQTRLIFCVRSGLKAGEPPLVLRFCHPSPELKERLTKDKNAWNVRGEQPAQAVIALVDQHAKQSFK